jgi:hypothetical protein
LYLLSRQKRVTDHVIDPLFEVVHDWVWLCRVAGDVAMAAAGGSTLAYVELAGDPSG